ncbi:deoxyuridine 5'-triphosphate nucleotidohydrolase [Denitrobacterium detoxificans]|uniref:dUTP diphosphatase n=1 Tax=Denitrobacterium detoxificans TaxID=79604 RepID=UPI0007C9DBF7|nr:dUTP diphosphatase [Denitrobacterium detoxificans]ANE22696.1 deoxyuridine 5'-triphosphate nucleotidohydrolase [Denitrobacterium detoxificans]
MSSLTLPVKVVNDNAVLPETAYEGDAGIDLRSVEDITLQPFERALIHTGICVAIPEGYAGFVLPRSGSAIKQGLSLVNAPGLIDSGYRGELMCIAINLDANEPIHVKVGDRIAQLVIMGVENVSLLVQDELSETQRGEGGFGSSGVK